MITGVIKDTTKAYQRKVSVNPIGHHYEGPGEEPYIKWHCPVCKMVGNNVQILRFTKRCPLCGVSLNWDRKPMVGDVVIIRGMQNPDFVDGDQCMIVEDRSEIPGEIPYVLEHNGKRLGCELDVFTILEHVIDEDK